jgi:hypothetical protein
MAHRYGKHRTPVCQCTRGYTCKPCVEAHVARGYHWTSDSGAVRRVSISGE